MSLAFISSATGMVSPTPTKGSRPCGTWLQVQWKDAGNQRFWFHDLRTKAIADMKELGRDAKHVSGHRTDAMVDRVYDRRRVRRRPSGEMILEHLRTLAATIVLSD